LDNVIYLIEHARVDVNVQNTWGRTPLHAACGRGNFDMVKCLVERGHADVTIKDRTGRTPLHFAPLYIRDYLNGTLPNVISQYSRMTI
jgi:ankyrin repeat protein